MVYGANDLAKIYEIKVKERDELLKSAFGYEDEDDFSRAMPNLDDGKYRPDGYDVVEEKEPEKFLLNVRKEMGYSNEDIEMIEQDDQKKKLQQPVDVPGMDMETMENRDEMQPIDALEGNIKDRRDKVSRLQLLATTRAPKIVQTKSLLSQLLVHMTPILSQSSWL